jgi:UDP-N-acetylglucosamine--N-acetylmuramyl-(pentapeptide) pyrophosphoryl-undecaprenol N-acetylglucosamine transferase
MQKKLKFIISGGGTGGHIFPAIAIANALQAQYPYSQMLFVGAVGKMEMQKVPAAGYDIVGLPIAGFQRSVSLKNIWANIQLPFKLLYSLIKAWFIIKKFAPNCVIGTGGYASSPVLIAAQWRGVPTVVQEQNAFAGVVNRWLGKRIYLAFVAYSSMDRFFRADSIRIFGNPVRQNILDNTLTKTQAAAHFGFDAGLPTVFVTGGSQGALGINNAILGGLEVLKNHNIQLIWQTGVAFEAKAQQAADGVDYGNRAVVQPFINDMQQAYIAADVVVSRAGAGAIAEVVALRKPCVLVPLPTAAADHQTKNAQALVQKNAAILVENAAASANLVPQIVALLHNTAQQNAMKMGLQNFDAPRATARIAHSILTEICGVDV